MKSNKAIILLFSTLHIYASLMGQSWQEANFHSREGYAALLEQYKNDDLLPIDERFDFYKTGVQAARHHQDSAWLQQFAYRVASTANALDSLDTALEYIAIARNAVSEEDDYAVNVINYQGVLHKQAGDYEQALAYYEEALQLARNKFPHKLIMPLSNIATLYRSQKNYPKTLEYLRELNEIMAELESPSREYHRVYNYAEFCIVHKTLNNLDSAAHYGQLCIQNLDRLDKRLNMKTAGFAYITVAELYIEKLQQPERAKPLLDSAFLYVEGLYINKVKVSLGKYYLATGALKEAGTVVRELQEADIKSQTTRLRALELAEQYYATIGDFESALASVKIIQQADAELFNEEKARLTAFYSAKFKNQQQEEEIQKLQYEQGVAKLKFQRQSLILILFSLFALTALTILSLQVRQKKKFAKVLQQEVEAKTRDLKMVNDLLTDKVDKLNTFNYTVSHDLSAPLSSAFNFLDLLQGPAGKASPSRSQQLLNSLRGALTHMKEMTEGVSLYLKADKMELRTEVVAPEKVVADVFSHLKYHYPDHLKSYTFTVHPPLPEIRVDPLLFRQAMTNLLSNAVKATRSTDHPRIQVTGRTTDQAVIITIKDNGIGIPPQNCDRLFELFKSAHPREQFPGTGAGLAIVKRIIERHGGTIQAESAGEEQGAAFTITLPPPSPSPP